MNSRNPIRARSLRAALLAGAGATLLVLAAPAAAQEMGASQAEPDDDAIIVTGIRETIQNSINAKREETAIVDVLSADDIGDIPAISVGQAIQTITGATTHREKGDASEIALRGLGPFLSNSTFNGRDASNGSGDRAVNFNQFPSELVNKIMIYKTQQANLVEGGVAGTIELGTLRPLDFGKRRIQGEVKAQYNPYGDRVIGSGGRAIVRAMIDLAKASGLKVTAEGVEREAQQRVLAHLGCDTLQGFYLSEPVAPEEIARFLGRTELHEA